MIDLYGSFFFFNLHFCGKLSKYANFALDYKFEILISVKKPFILQEMKKIVAVAFFFIALVETANAQLLFSISGKGLQKPSYILGSHHFVPSHFTDSITGFQSAFNSVEQVVGEIDLKENNLMQVQADIMKQCMLPDSITLMSLFSEQEVADIDSIATLLMGVNLSNPLLASSLGKMTPNMITLLFEGLLYEKIYQDTGLGEKIDSYVQSLAIDNGKNVKGLETADEQIHMLITSASMDRQKELLLCFVRNIDYNAMIVKMLTDAYLSKNLKKIEKVANMQRGDHCDSTEEEQKILLDERNKKWICQMPGIMAEHPTLFVVGAAHLVGKQGIIRMLKNYGYRVKPVKTK